MRTYEIETADGQKCFVVAPSIDEATDLVTKTLGLSTKNPFRKNNSEIVTEPGIYTKALS
jgi:hypothetical protein